MKRFFRYIRSLYRNLNRRPDIPRLLTYLVTFKCNARCVMCDSWKKSTENDLSLNEIEMIFRQLPELDGVRLSGGEPFVRSDIGEIARLAQDILKPMVLHVTTNGMLTDRIVTFCAERDREIPFQLMISIDGMKEKHDATRGVGNAWERAVETIRLLEPLQKELNLELYVNQTIVDSDGYEQYRLLREFLRPYNIRNNVVVAYKESATYSTGSSIDVAPESGGELETFTEMDTASLSRLFDEVERDVNCMPLKYKLAKQFYIRGVKNRLLNSDSSPNPPCVALSSHMRLYPDGTVPVCQFNSSVVGDLRNETFSDLWSGRRIQSYREWVKKCPGCWAECEILPNAIYTGEILTNTMKAG